MESSYRSAKQKVKLKNKNSELNFLKSQIYKNINKTDGCGTSQLFFRSFGFVPL